MRLDPPYTTDFGRAQDPATGLSHPHSGERALGSIVSDLWSHSEILVHQEIDLVKADLDAKAQRVKHDVTAASLSGAIMYAGVLAMVAGSIALLSRWLDVWLAAFSIGAAVLAIGYLTMRRSTKDLETLDPVPRKSEESLKRDAQTVLQARPMAKKGGRP